MNDFSHINDNGNAAMVDISEKTVTKRTATAQSIVSLPADVLNKLINNNMQSAKGAVFQTAIIAGIMASKKTGELIPLCHPLSLDDCKVEIGINQRNEIEINCTAAITAKTGVEMEALTGASFAALTVYDMCKALSHDIIIRETKLIEKTGGKRDFKR